MISGAICNGEIDYDESFDKLVCKVCGAEYNARDLASSIEEGKINLINSFNVEGDLNMEIQVLRGNKVLFEKDLSNEPTKTFKRKKDPKINDFTVRLEKVSTKELEEIQNEQVNTSKYNAPVTTPPVKLDNMDVSTGFEKVDVVIGVDVEVGNPIYDKNKSSFEPLTDEERNALLSNSSDDENEIYSKEYPNEIDTGEPVGEEYPNGYEEDNVYESDYEQEDKPDIEMYLDESQDRKDEIIDRVEPTYNTIPPALRELQDETKVSSLITRRNRDKDVISKY